MPDRDAERGREGEALQALRRLSREQRRALLKRTIAAREAPSAGDVAPARSSSAGDGWLSTPLQRPAARVRLACFPEAGAEASVFGGWVRRLPPEVEVLVARWPGERPFEELVESIVRGLEQYLDRPLALYGGGAGAGVAFAVAQALEEGRGVRAAHVVLTATPPPGDVRSAPLNCPLTVLGGGAEASATAEALAAWGARTAGPFRLEFLERSRLLDGVESDEAADAMLDCLRPLLGGRPWLEPSRRPTGAANGELGLSLFFFSATEDDTATDKYRLLHECVRHADREGWRAVWLPERHFHPVGGLYPNPSVVGAAVAATTSAIRIRSGSVVLPLHDPLRVAEEWSVVDNLSGGRVDLAFVPGWNPNDYVLAPDRFARRWETVFEHADAVSRLWRGEPVIRTNGAGHSVPTRTYPRPVQPELSVWIATSARDESFVRAGEIGANVISALLIQGVDELAEKILLYREARARAGHDPSAGCVTLMVPAYVDIDLDAARRTVRAPFIAYMKSVKSLWKDAVEALQPAALRDEERLVEMVFERYFQHSTLFGDVQTCLRKANEFRAAGVDEVACMIDFGVGLEDTLRSLHLLDRVWSARAGQEGRVDERG
jgi:natural product biosynthesis luciferase-like monooxygenase protein